MLHAIRPTQKTYSFKNHMPIADNIQLFTVQKITRINCVKF